MKLTYKYNSFYEMIEANAKVAPKKTTVFIDKEKISNADFLSRVDSFARFLQITGIGAGDKVALILPNSLEFIIAVYATTKLGAIIVPINNLLKRSEYEFILNDCQASILITSNDFEKEVSNLDEKTPIHQTVWIDDYSALDKKNIQYGEVSHTNASQDEQFAQVHLDDLAVIFYTSGTTGNPKGAMLSYRNIFSNMIGAEESFNITQKDRFIVYLPMFHAFTFSVMVMLPFYSNASSVIIRKILPFSNIIKQTLLKGVTIFLGVPDIYNALIRAKLPWYFLWFNRIRIFISGASALSEDTMNKFNAIFKRAQMLEGYGLSECSPAVCVNRMGKQKVLSVGQALPSYEMKVVDDEMVEVPLGDVGEVIVKGDCVMLGYLNNEEATKDSILNGWFRTGDLGKMDDEGYLYIVDRMKDLIISKGINIYPRQIEEELMKLPYLKAAAVIGIKDTNSGEVPIAFVELEDEGDHSHVNQALMKKELKLTLANFKIPKVITVIEELPKNATGKVLKRVLKDKVNEKGELI